MNRGLAFPFLAALALLVSASQLGAREALPQSSPWDIAHLGKAPEAEWGEMIGRIQEVLYRGEPFGGRPTQVFAYVGRPDGEGPFPGIVLVHGGGGQAFKDWADHWAKRGYVAISMDTAGNGKGRERLTNGGPDQLDTVKFRNFDASEIREMWSYHAVANVVLAHSLILSLPEVDPERTALTGISWGGYLTCIAVGVDPRFKAAVPVYGCGFLHGDSIWKDNGALAKMEGDARRLWIRNFDPGQHVWKTSCPILFFNGTNDFAYHLPSFRKTVEQVNPELATVALHHRLKHGHFWDFKIVDAYVDSILGGGQKLARIGDLRVTGNLAHAPVLTDTPIAGAELWFTADGGKWQARKWEMIPAEVSGRTIRAELPEPRPLTFFLQSLDGRGLRTSSTHATLTDSAGPNPATIPTPKLEQDFYDWHKRHAEALRIKGEIDPEIILIGDSITHMWGGLPAEPDRARGADSWDALFGNRALNLGFGWDRTQNVLWRIEHGELDGLAPRLVVIHIGTNNLTGTKSHKAGTPAEIAAGIKAVAGQVRTRLPDAKIVLMAVFPRGEKPDDPFRKPIAEINALLPDIAKIFGAEFLDITGNLLDENGVYPKDLASDSLHPTARGYGIWAEALRPYIQ